MPLRTRPIRTALLALVLALAALPAGGCTARPHPVHRASPTPSVVTVALRPAAGTTVAAGESADARARTVSAALFASAPGAVVAPAATAAATAESARLHLPLLLTGKDGDEALASELRRLSARWVVPVGRVPAHAVAGLPRMPAGRATPASVPEPAQRPVVVLADPAADAAAAATARAAGATVVPAGTADLVASSKVVTALSEPSRGAAVLVGSAFAGRRDVTWALRAASSGFQLPGGGQRPFDGRRFVALYGTPGAPVLGVLGRQGLPETVRRAAEQAAAYDPLSPEPVVPALELIATVASGSPGSDGNYSNELPVSRLESYVDAAARAHQSVLLDLQPGRSDFLQQARRYQRLLERPHVGLALDPEWRLGPHEKPLVRIGSVRAAEVNRVSAWLDDLVQRRGLPPKMFVLHQFRPSMLPDRSRIALRPQLATLIHVDGQGGQPDKQATWRTLQKDAPKGVAWGWKNFLRKDHPVLTPAQTMREVRPVPSLITYQ